MSDIMTEIKSNIFGRVWLLKNLFFFECLYFSGNNIWTLLFVFWLRNRPSIKYVRNCTGAHRDWGVEKLVIRYVRTKWIAPNKCCGIFFVYWFGQVHKSIATSKKNAVVFFHSNYDCFTLCDNYNLVSCFYIRISTKKQAFDFLKRNSYTNVCLKSLYEAKLITLLLIF